MRERGRCGREAVSGKQLLEMLVRGEGEKVTGRSGYPVASRSLMLNLTKFSRDRRATVDPRREISGPPMATWSLMLKLS